METRVHKGLDCWCDPIVLRECGECVGGRGVNGAECWCCGGAALVECEPDDEGALICHDVTDESDDDDPDALVIEIEEDDEWQ